MGPPPWPGPTRSAAVFTSRSRERPTEPTRRRRACASARPFGARCATAGRWCCRSRAARRATCAREIADSRAVGVESLSRAGSGHLAIEPLARPIGRLRGGPVRVVVRSGAPGARRAVERTLTLNLRRKPRAPHPRARADGPAQREQCRRALAYEPPGLGRRSDGDRPRDARWSARRRWWSTNPGPSRQPGRFEVRLRAAADTSLGRRARRRGRSRVTHAPHVGAGPRVRRALVALALRSRCRRPRARRRSTSCRFSPSAAARPACGRPARPGELVRWYSGGAEILTVQPSGLVATGAGAARAADRLPRRGLGSERGRRHGARRAESRAGRRPRAGRSMGAARSRSRRATTRTSTSRSPPAVTPSWCGPRSVTPLEGRVRVARRAPGGGVRAARDAQAGESSAPRSRRSGPGWTARGNALVLFTTDGTRGRSTVNVVSAPPGGPFGARAPARRRVDRRSRAGGRRRRTRARDRERLRRPRGLRAPAGRRLRAAARSRSKRRPRTSRSRCAPGGAAAIAWQNTRRRGRVRGRARRRDAVRDVDPGPEAAATEGRSSLGLRGACDRPRRRPATGGHRKRCASRSVPTAAHCSCGRPTTAALGTATVTSSGTHRDRHARQPIALAARAVATAVRRRHPRARVDRRPPVPRRRAVGRTPASRARGRGRAAGQAGADDQGRPRRAAANSVRRSR